MLSSTDSDEARRLLEQAREWMPVGDTPPGWKEPILKWRVDVDAFLAQPEPAAREAVLVSAIQHSVGDWDEHADCEYGRCLACATLAGTSPAAAALLATLRDWPNDGHSDTCSFLNDLVSSKANRRKCDCGFEAREAARAALAPGEESWR